MCYFLTKGKELLQRYWAWAWGRGGNVPCILECIHNVLVPTIFGVPGGTDTFIINLWFEHYNVQYIISQKFRQLTFVSLVLIDEFVHLQLWQPLWPWRN